LGLIFNIGNTLIFFDLIKDFKKELFNGLSHWILDEEPNYPLLEECKLCIKNQNS